MIQVVFTRHAESEFNVFTEKGGNKTADLRDCSLSQYGFQQIKENKDALLSKFQADIVFVSPLTRCIQTCLETYSDPSPPLYAMSLLTEYLDTPDCIGTLPDILQSKFPLIDFETFMMQDNPNTPDNWYEPDFRKNITKRVDQFTKFLETQAKDYKKIHVITHGGFIQRIIQKPIDNYSSFLLNYDTQQHKWTPSWRAIKPLY
jgi:broad specificity phosphatase PhoE